MNTAVTCFICENVLETLPTVVLKEKTCEPDYRLKYGF